MAKHLIFTTSGDYEVDYEGFVECSFYTGSLPVASNSPANKVNFEDYQKNHEGSFTTSTVGQLKFTITPKQSSWGW